MNPKSEGSADSGRTTEPRAALERIATAGMDAGEARFWGERRLRKEAESIGGADRLAHRLMDRIERFIDSVPGIVVTAWNASDESTPIQYPTDAEWRNYFADPLQAETEQCADCANEPRGGSLANPTPTGQISPLTAGKRSDVAGQPTDPSPDRVQRATEKAWRACERYERDRDGQAPTRDLVAIAVRLAIAALQPDPDEVETGQPPITYAESQAHAAAVQKVALDNGRKEERRRIIALIEGKRLPDVSDYDKAYNEAIEETLTAINEGSEDE